MTHTDIDTALGWRGQTVFDRDGEELGRLGDVFLDERTSRPAWAGVRTGLFGMRETYVPLDAVRETGDGLQLPFPAGLVTNAPRIDPDVALTAEEEAALWRHYGHDYGDGDDGPAAEVVRSEEEVHAERGPMRPAERVRLRKVLVTEHERRVVPVRKEVVQLETEPPPAGGVEVALDEDARGER